MTPCVSVSDTLGTAPTAHGQQGFTGRVSGSPRKRVPFFAGHKFNLTPMKESLKSPHVSGIITFVRISSSIRLSVYPIRSVHPSITAAVREAGLGEAVFSLRRFPGADALPDDPALGLDPPVPMAA